MHCCTYKHTHAQTHILRFYIIGLYRCVWACVCLFILCVYMYTVYTSVYACTQVSWSQHDIWGRVIQLFLWIPYYKGQYCRNSRPSGYDHPLSGENNPCLDHHRTICILVTPFYKFPAASRPWLRASRFGAVLVLCQLTVLSQESKKHQTSHRPCNCKAMLLNTQRFNGVSAECWDSYKRVTQWEYDALAFSNSLSNPIIRNYNTDIILAIPITIKYAKSRYTIRKNKNTPK